jgi:hypothetical protein
MPQNYVQKVFYTFAFSYIEALKVEGGRGEESVAAQGFNLDFYWPVHV